MNRYLTALEIADRLDCSKAMAYQLIKQHMAFLRLGKSGIRVRDSEFERFQRENTERPCRDQSSFTHRGISTNAGASGGAGSTTGTVHGSDGQPGAPAKPPPSHAYVDGNKKLRLKRLSGLTPIQSKTR